MPLDAETAALIAEVNRTQASLGSLSAAETRLAVRARGTIDGPPEPVAHIENRVIATAGAALPVRIYRPAGLHLPAIVYFHGGGWTVCDLDTHDSACRRIANAAGAVVISVNYRLAPENPFPAAVLDAIQATEWALVHGPSELAIDGSKVLVMGDSAGANLSTVTCLSLRGRPNLPPLAGQVLIVPVTSYLPDNSSYRDNADGYFLTRGAMEWFFGHYLKQPADQFDWRAFPMLAEDLSGLPPALVITAEFDPLRDEGEAYAERLMQAGVTTELVRYDGTIHQFVLFAGRLSQGRRATERIGRFVQRVSQRAQAVRGM